LITAARRARTRPRPHQPGAAPPPGAVEQPARDLADVARVHPDLAEELVHHGRLRPEPERRVDHVVGEAPAVAAVALPAAAPAQAVHLEDPDALDALERLDRLADDPLELVDEPDAHRGQPRLGRQEVLGLVHEARALRLHLVADARRDRPHPLRVGQRLGLRPDRGPAVPRRRPLRLGPDAHAQGVPLGLLLGADEIDALPPLDHLRLARGEDALLLGHRPGPRQVARGLGVRLGPGLLGHRDRPVLLAELHRLALGNLELLDPSLLEDPLLLDGPLRGQPRPVHGLPRPDLGALGLLLLLGALAGDVGPLGGPLHLELPLLGEARVLELPVDLEGLPLGLEVLVAHLDRGVLLDVVPDLLAALDLLGEARQTLGVEGVRRVEVLHRRLVELSEGDRLQLEAVLQEVRRAQAYRSSGLPGHLRRARTASASISIRAPGLTNPLTWTSVLEG
jgi:hypothetical protein